MVSTELTEAAKFLIRTAPLYDTGALHNSIGVSYELRGQTLVIELTALEYLSYHIDRIFFVDDFMSSQAVANLSGVVFAPVIEREAARSLSANVEFQFAPKIQLSINYI